MSSGTRLSVRIDCFSPLMEDQSLTPVRSKYGRSTSGSLCLIESDEQYDF